MKQKPGNECVCRFPGCGLPEVVHAWRMDEDAGARAPGHGVNRVDQAAFLAEAGCSVDRRG